MTNIPLRELFIVRYGTDLELNKLKQDPHGINFVSRNRKNNGVVARVLPVEGINPNPAGTISVALGSSSVLFSYLQDEPYYSGRDLAYLVPKIEMTKKQLLFYCTCIIKNRYKYNYGRQANRTISSLYIPAIDQIPKWVQDIELKDIAYYSQKYSNEPTDKFNIANWHDFIYDEIFTIERGESYYIKYSGKGKFPYASASDENNGITSNVDTYNREGNLIVLNYDGSVASAFYQADKFFASEKVVTLSLKDYELNKYIAMFIITVIRKEKFRYNYGRKWSVEKRMRNSIIKLPAKMITRGSKIEYIPDYNYMESYIKTLSFTKAL